MLAPIPKKRRDGKSSFRSLCNYLLYENDIEIHVPAMRGDYIISDNIISLETLALEMGAAAGENPRSSDPVYHYILSWQEGESPSRRQWEEAAKKTIEDLGFKEHQYLAVAHTDTDAFHVHVVVNRVHPEKYHAHYPKFSKLTLDKSLREIEAKQEWKESRGLYRWDSERLQAVKTGRELLAEWRKEREIDVATGKAAKMEIYSNAESLETYCRGQPAKEVALVLGKGSVTWNDLHEVLKKHGLVIRPSDRGGYTISALDGEVRVNASKVFRATFAGKENRALLKQKLGDFSEPSRYVNVVKTEVSYKKSREPLKRNPYMRAVRREERAKAREQLKEDYMVYRRACYYQAIIHTAEGKKKYESLRQDYWENRRKIRESKLSPELRKAARSILAMQAIQEKEQLQLEIKARRDGEKSKSYFDWVRDKAELGDEAAISQVKGFQYAGKKQRKRTLQMEAEHQPQANVIKAATLDLFDPIATSFPGVAWKVNRLTGDVTYSISGNVAFTDRGARIDVLPINERSHSLKIEIAMKLAQQKYGNTLNLAGDDVFKRQCVETVVKNKMNIQFSDLNLNQLKKQLERQRTRDRGR